MINYSKYLVNKKTNNNDIDNKKKINNVNNLNVSNQINLNGYLTGMINNKPDNNKSIYESIYKKLNELSKEE